MGCPITYPGAGFFLPVRIMVFDANFNDISAIS
jgi:hypothetical protein